MKKVKPDNLAVSQGVVQTKKSKAFLYATCGFLVAVILISCIIGFIVVPMLNRNLKKMGIESINEFVGFYQDLNQYVAEDEIVKNSFSNSDYQSAYGKLKNSGLNVFKDLNVVSDLDSSKIESFDYSEYEENINGIDLSSKELAALLDNTLKSEGFIESLNIEVINQYKLGLEIKELSISENSKFIGDCFNFVMVGKISLEEVAKSLPWPYNGMLPSSIYVLTESIVRYKPDNTIEFLEYGINLNNMSSKSHEIIVKIINSRLKDEGKESFTLEGFTKDLNINVYNRIEMFANKLHSSIQIVKTVEDDEQKIVFNLEYKE